MSTVYLAIQISVGRVVALKVMSPLLNGDPAFSERFQREANIVGQLSHPNIVAIYDIGRHDNLNYIAMDYLPGGSVHDRMMKGISPEEALRITREIAVALDHAHEKGYVHRDIKPENILFRADHSAVLTDFGVAKGVGGVSRMTNVGQVVGTPHYMSPEQTRGKHLDARSDLYSLGVVFYEMLTGSVPFQGDEAVAIAIKHISAPIPRLPRHCQAYQKLLNKLLAKDPEQRFQRGRDLAQAIEELENGQKTTGASANPADLSAPDLLKALGESTWRGLRWRLRRLAQWRWAPKQGFYRRSTTRITQLVMSDEEYNTLIATRLQDAIHHPGDRRRWITWGLLGAAGLVLLWGGFHLIVSGPVESPSSEQILAQAPEPATAPTDEQDTRGDAQQVVTSAPANGHETDQPTVAADTEGELIGITQSPDPSQRTPLETYEGVPDEEAAAASSQSSSAEPVRYGLTVTTEPEGARVRILNIVPRYAPGIALTPGPYHIEVSHPDHITHTEWITLEDADLRQHVVLEARRQFAGPFTSELTNGRQGPSMVPVPGGSFTMGDDSDSQAAPAHQVTIGYRFAISQYEITFAEYDLFAQATNRALPGDNRWGRDRRPVIHVSWEDARAYAAWLSRMTGERYRLPTESEWEYAARAGSGSPYAWGDEPAEGKANCRRGCGSRYSGLFGARTAPVGSFPPNSFGIYDMAGNVAEWVQDCFADNYAAKPRNGRAYETADCATRAVRGGSARNNLEHLTSFAREHQSPDVYKEYLGFRVVMEID